MGARERKPSFEYQLCSMERADARRMAHNLLMPTHNLSKIFQPRSVALVGASARPGSVGRTVLENLQRAGFGSEIYPINPKRTSLLNLTTYPSVGALPHPPDLAIIATPAESVPGLITECGEAGVPGVIILSAGFSEVGSRGRSIEADLARNIDRFPDIRVIGPNCLGVMVPNSRLNASFRHGQTRTCRLHFAKRCAVHIDPRLVARRGHWFLLLRIDR
jgi:acetyltransferase